MKQYLLFILSCITLFSFPACARKNTIQPELAERLKKIAIEQHIPTLSVKIKSSKVNLDLQFQNSDKGIKPIESYGVASTTKLLASTLIMKLVEDGKLKLEDKIVKYINPADFNGINWLESITVRDLLSHSSGISDYTKNPDFMKLVMSGRGPSSYNEKISLIKQDDTTLQFGRHAYSNSNYILLQKIVEQVTGKDAIVAFNDFYTSQSLPNIRLTSTKDINQAFFAQQLNSVGDVSGWQEYYGFDGGAFAKATDLELFLRKLFIHKQILRQSSLSEMESWVDVNQYTINYGFAKMSAYGLGLMKYEFDNRIWIGHSGSSLKYQSFAFVEQATGATVILQTNCSGKYYNNTFFIALMEEIVKDI